VAGHVGEELPQVAERVERMVGADQVPGAFLPRLAERGGDPGPARDIKQAVVVAEQEQPVDRSGLVSGRLMLA
jgi:hypothetical protein